MIGDNVFGTDHPRIMRAMEKHIPRTDFEALMTQLQGLADHFDVRGLKALLAEAVDGYTPDLSEAAMLAEAGSSAAADAAKVVPIRA